MAEAAFFARLPPVGLSPAEEDLRALLLQAASAASKLLPRSGAVSLQKWVERRMPDELRLCTDAAGDVVLLPLPPQAQVVAPRTPAAHVPSAPGLEPFFDSLPNDDFLPEETLLREAVTNAVARGPLPMIQVVRDEQVRAAKTFLPRFVTLEDWIERRIGGEVAVYKDKMGRASCKLVGPSKEERNEIAEQFWAALPEGSFTKEEERLRTAIYEFLANWRSPELASLSHSGGDKAVRQARMALLKPGACVSLKDWIERRLGAELELRQDQTMQWIIHLTELGKAEVRRAAQMAVRGLPRRGAFGEPAMAPWAQPLVEKENMDEQREKFFAALPEDSLSVEEVNLRASLMDFLNSWTADMPPTLTDAGQDAEVKMHRLNLLPKGCCVSLRAWIDQRIGGEIETVQQENTSKEVFFGLRGMIDRSVLDLAAQRENKRKADGNVKLRIAGESPPARRLRR
mmetsp:Transcript_37728/g.82896  ORF Transcript_37728/g.82896 Transcript_37728/m.82896 type:complete len:457 (-) Transcript_37728:65-1435(-)